MANPLNTIEIREIMDLLPHRYPFLLIDRVTDYELGVSIKAYKNTIKFLKSQIHELELKKLKAHGENCPECFKFKIASGK